MTVLRGIWRRFGHYWPYLAIAVGVGLVAYSLYENGQQGDKISDQQEALHKTDQRLAAQQAQIAASIRENRHTICVVGRIRAAPQVPGENNAQYRKRLRSYIPATLALRGVNCQSVLFPPGWRHQAEAAAQAQGGGGAQTPSKGSQQQGGRHPPSHKPPPTGTKRPTNPGNGNTSPGHGPDGQGPPGLLDGACGMLPKNQITTAC